MRLLRLPPPGVDATGFPAFWVIEMFQGPVDPSRRSPPLLPLPAVPHSTRPYVDFSQPVPSTMSNAAACSFSVPHALAPARESTVSTSAKPRAHTSSESVAAVAPKPSAVTKTAATGKASTTLVQPWLSSIQQIIPLADKMFGLYEQFGLLAAPLPLPVKQKAARGYKEQRAHGFAEELREKHVSGLRMRRGKARKYEMSENDGDRFEKNRGAPALSEGERAIREPAVRPDLLLLRPLPRLPKGKGTTGSPAPNALRSGPQLVPYPSYQSAQQQSAREQPADAQPPHSLRDHLGDRPAAGARSPGRAARQDTERRPFSTVFTALYLFPNGVTNICIKRLVARSLPVFRVSSLSYTRIQKRSLYTTGTQPR